MSCGDPNCTHPDCVGSRGVRASQLRARIVVLERLLIDARRMAEFGDINEDMEDDGIGWKQWYVDSGVALWGDTRHPDSPSQREVK